MSIFGFLREFDTQSFLNTMQVKFFLLTIDKNSSKGM